MIFAVTMCAAYAFSQTAANSVTVTATRNTNLQPDQVVFGVTVETGLDANRDDVVNALQGSGITAANFTGVSTAQVYTTGLTQAAQALEWQFALPVAISNMTTTIGQLSAVQKNMAQGKTGFTMSFGVQGTQVSTQLQQSQPCAAADLVSDARTQAQKLAAAAGMSVGAIMAMAGPAVAASSSVNPFSSATYYPVCTLTVKFALGAF